MGNLEKKKRKEKKKGEKIPSSCLPKRLAALIRRLRVCICSYNDPLSDFLACHDSPARRHTSPRRIPLPLVNRLEFYIRPSTRILIFGFNAFNEKSSMLFPSSLSVKVPNPSRLILGLVLTTLLSGVSSITVVYPGGSVPSLSYPGSVDILCLLRRLLSELSLSLW